MNILIKGMKKPTACYKCQLRTGKYCGILTENEKCADDGVLPNCPIVEVPPYSRLIDANMVYQELLPYSNRFRKSVLKVIENIPTVIETEEEEHE